MALGGAAGRIPDPTSRGVYTYRGNPLLTHPGNAVHRANPLIDAALLGIGDPGDPDRDELVDVIRGMEVVGGRNGNPGNRMGDPLHGKPALITYGGTSGIPTPRIKPFTWPPMTDTCTPSMHGRALNAGRSYRPSSSAISHFFMPTTPIGKALRNRRQRQRLSSRRRRWSHRTRRGRARVPVLRDAPWRLVILRSGRHAGGLPASALANGSHVVAWRWADLVHANADSNRNSGYGTERPEPGAGFRRRLRHQPGPATREYRS